MVRRYALICAQTLCVLLLSAAAFAQSANPVLPAGDAAVAGFSGTIVLASPPEPRRIDKTYINLDGPSLQVIGLARMGGPPRAQLVAAPRPFTATAGQIGQVFALALDDADPPNIYAAATSAYGLPIVVPDADGDGFPDRSHRGAPNAAFMPGLFGPVQLNGGPGSIWKINGQTGAVTLFANVVLGGVPNSGSALGGLAFDRASRQLFVADRDTGMIHRFTLDGAERGRFDHGTQALGAAGLPPIAFDPRKRLNIESPNFDSGDPTTWAYAPPARRVFGMAVNGGRLYYAVAAGLRIWSVSLLPDGSFGPDARVEVAVPPGALSGSEVSEILFDDNGDMLVAERGTPTGAYDYKTLAAARENRVLRFRPKTPDDPPSRDLWFPIPREYAIGFPPNYRNDNGGIAIGYGYDQAGNINRAVCGGTLWSTGEQLRNARDPEIIRRLQAGGPLIVDGLQGNSTRLLRPLNEPPFEAYYIDYDDRFDDEGTRGYLGDVVIWRTCGQAALPLVPVVCPPGLFDIDGICQFPLACPSGTEFSNGCCAYRGCPASYVRINGKCVPPPANCKSEETYANGRCEAPKCPAGLVPVKSQSGGGAGPNGANVANSSATNSGALNQLEGALQRANGGCPAGTVLNSDQCQPVRNQPKMCGGNTYCKCPDGTQVSEDGKCIKSTCPPQTILIDGVCCTRQDLLNGTCHWRPLPPPDLTIRKDAPKSCHLLTTGSLVNALGGPVYLCKFTITVTNNGTTPASGATFTDTATPPARIVDFAPLDSNGQPDINSTAWQCSDPTNAPLTCKRQAGSDIPAGESVQVVVATATLVSANTGTIGNCAAVGDTPALNQGQPATSDLGANPSFNPNTPAGQDLSDLAGRQRKVDCKTVQIAPPPQTTPPVTATCTPTRMPACSGPLVGEGDNRKPLCHAGQCDCGGPLVGEGDNRKPLCRADECMTTCPPPPSLVRPLPPPLPPPTTAVCGDGSAPNSDGNCPTPTTTSCPSPTFLVNGMCCDARSYQAGTCGRPPVAGACANGQPRNSDGNCPTSQTTCSFDKVLRDGKCVCLRGVGDDCHIPKKETTRKKKSKPSDNPPVQSGPNIQIQIGPGFPGGGRPGGGKPGGGKPPSGGGLNRSPG
ncbi:MAG TPA: hypothetical protein VEC94_14135 [Pseudolabrys sp.]|nr:hypothetical protein [Pseudolabrys sp.]